MSVKASIAGLWLAGQIIGYTLAVNPATTVIGWAVIAHTNQIAASAAVATAPLP